MESVEFQRDNSSENKYNNEKNIHIWRWAVYYIYLLKRVDGFPKFTKSLGKILQVAHCLVILSGS